MSGRVSNEDAKALLTDPMATQWFKAYAQDLLDARRERDEARSALLWLFAYQAWGGPAPLPDFVNHAVRIADAARAAERALRGKE